jgi:hypothetical protein
MLGIFFIFSIMLFVRKINSFLNKDAATPFIQNQSSNNIIINYLPLVFHGIIVLFIVGSIFSANLLTEDSVMALLNDVSFQFYATLLLVIISLVNPFTKLSQNTTQKITEFANQTKNTSLNWVLHCKNFQLLKLLVCTLFIFHFVYNGYIKFPSFNSGITSSIAAFLILFYLFNSLVQLFKNPEDFRNSNILRLTVLTQSLKFSFFTLIGVVILVFIPSEIIGFKFQNDIDPMIFALLAYNIVMAHNEFKVLKMIKSYNQTQSVSVS